VRAQAPSRRAPGAEPHRRRACVLLARSNMLEGALDRGALRFGRLAVDRDELE
jgi:hypothetical protein